jgi:hypothetical protein
MFNDEELSVQLGHAFKSATSDIAAPVGLSGSVAHRIRMRRRMKMTGVAGVAVACATLISTQLPASTSQIARSGPAAPGAQLYRLTSYKSAATLQVAARHLPCLPFHMGPPVTNGREPIYFVLDPRYNNVLVRVDQACIKLMAITRESLPAGTEPVPGHSNLYFGARYGGLRSGYFRATVQGPHTRQVVVSVWADDSVSDRDFVKVLTATTTHMQVWTWCPKDCHR